MTDQQGDHDDRDAERKTVDVEPEDQPDPGDPGDPDSTDDVGPETDDD
jgi:hypothetical protein